jgi:uncharacterized protein (DUF427 family)
VAGGARRAHDELVRTEPIDKRVRGIVGSTVVVDTRRPLLYWEDSFPVPGYAVDPDDVRTDLLTESAGEPDAGELGFHAPRGPVARWYDLRVGDRVVPHAAWVRDDPALRDLLVVSWRPGGVDRWLEEDEEVRGHPRDPHSRVETLPSRRHVVVEADGVLLAESERPVLLLETGLPTRYYLPRADVRFEALEPSDNHSFCPYKGDTTEYWSVAGRPALRNIAWSYWSPLPAVQRVAGLVAFYNELLDLTVDGVRLDRADSPFSDPAHRPGS